MVRSRGRNVPSVSRRPAGLGLRQGSRGQGRGQGRERTCRCCEVLGFHSESTGSCGLTDSFRESLWLLRDCRGRACKGKTGQGGGSVPPSGHPTASGHRFRSSIWGGGGDWTAGFLFACLGPTKWLLGTNSSSCSLIVFCSFPNCI